MALRFNSVGDSERMISTFGIRPAVLFDDLDDIRAAVESAILATGFLTAPNILNGWAFNGFELVRATATGDESLEWINPIVGTLAGGGFASNTAVLIQKRTGLGGRRHRGRMFLPPILFADIGADNNGFLTPALLANLTSTFDFFMTNLEDAEVPMVLHHGGVALDSQLVTSLAPAPQLATQRRRMRP